MKKFGFEIVGIMEKYCEEWKLGKTEIFFDTLPMGKFIEIEGRKKQIERVAKMLGLNFKERITKNYRELWEKFCKEKGIKDENITFASLKKLKNKLSYFFFLIFIPTSFPSSGINSLSNCFSSMLGIFSFNSLIFFLINSSLLIKIFRARTNNNNCAPVV